MDNAEPCCSNSLSSTSKSSWNNLASGEAETNNVRGKKRSFPSDDSSASSSSSSFQLPCTENTAGFDDAPAEVSLESADFKCLICLENVQEATSTTCGHTYCRSCIEDAIDNNGRCPSCYASLTKENLFPNFMITDVMARSRSRSMAVKAEIFESTTPLLPTEAPPTKLVKFLTNTNLGHLTIGEVDRLVMLLGKRRETMTLDDEKCQRVLLEEFLSNLSKIKSKQMEQLKRELYLINQDMEVIKTSNINYDTTSTGSPVSTSSELDQVDFCSSSAEGMGFNSQSTTDELNQQSLSARNRRMYNHFDELIQVYLDARNSQVFDDRTTADGDIEDEEGQVLSRFGQTLSYATQYHGLKPLSTIIYNTDADLNSNANASSNIVSSIEFDKDNEFFAIAGVNMKIKLFEYLKVIAYDFQVHSPSAEITCKARISCVAWNNYYKNSLACSDYDGSVSLWDMSRCTRVQSLIEHEKRAWSVDWSKGNPRLLASGSDDSRVKLWATNSDKSIANLEIQANVCCVKFCPEGSYMIAVGSADHCIHYYDFRNPRQPFAVLCGHKKTVSYVQFTSKCEMISASTDSNLKLWNLDDPMSCVKSFTGHTNEKNFVGLATDGNYIASGSENNSLYIYYKLLSKPLFSFKLENHTSMMERRKVVKSTGPEFISSVTWKKGSPVVIAANSEGTIKILELV